MKKKLGLLLLFCWISVGYTNQIDELDQFIEASIKEWNVPGAAIIVVKDGKPILNKGYGIRKAGTNDQVDENTIFQLASITKTFTAAGLGTQVDQEKLSWDDPVINHLPNLMLKELYPTRFTTSRDLLAHRTGLGAFSGDLLGKLGYTDEEILHRIRFITPTTSFRDKAQYSNIGFFIAGELLSTLSGKSYRESVKTLLLEPLSMKNSGFEELLDRKNVAYGHILEDDRAKVVPWDRTSGLPAAGGMTSTSTDMGTWMIMLLNRGSYKGAELLKPETVDEMFRSSMAADLSFTEVAPIDEYSGFDFGLGWGNYHYKNRMIVEKGGGLDGVRTLTTLIPQENLGITILANQNLTFLPEAIRAKFLELYLGKSEQDMQKLIKEKAEEAAKFIAGESKPKKQLPLSHSLSAFTGTFENALYGTFVVREESGKLVVDAGPLPFKGELAPYSLDTFVLEWPVVNSGGDLVTFTFGPDGKAQSFEVESLGNFTLQGVDR